MSFTSVFEVDNSFADERGVWQSLTIADEEEKGSATFLTIADKEGEGSEQTQIGMMSYMASP